MPWASFSMLDGESNTYYSARSRWTKQQQNTGVSQKTTEDRTATKDTKTQKLPVVQTVKFSLLKKNAMAEPGTNSRSLE